jgi:DNA-binding GntR family transcriptional regulator
MDPLTHAPFLWEQVYAVLEDQLVRRKLAPGSLVETQVAVQLVVSPYPVRERFGRSSAKAGSSATTATGSRSLTPAGSVGVPHAFPRRCGKGLRQQRPGRAGGPARQARHLARLDDATGRGGDSSDEHTEFHRAMCNHDSQAAAALARQHVDRSSQALDAVERESS